MAPVQNLRQRSRAVSPPSPQDALKSADLRRRRNTAEATYVLSASPATTFWRLERGRRVESTAFRKSFGLRRGFGGTTSNSTSSASYQTTWLSGPPLAHAGADLSAESDHPSAEFHAKRFWVMSQHGQLAAVACCGSAANLSVQADRQVGYSSSVPKTHASPLPRRAGGGRWPITAWTRPKS